ncbi:C-C chemokine receptor type 4-like [Colossoma macropomum]|uniref:C-C chemokine receptor type 4-like n=1 Tax=Colossoma macropomum TaxID=42526 RepID=UPI001864DB22|nr:C-C chemokine receptor type 4-like [Colossoma macropomum]
MPCVYGSHHNSFLPVLYSLLFVVGFLGNMFMVWVFKAGNQLKTMTDVCLLNLALADLLLVLSLPFLAHYAGHSWIFGRAMCTIVLGIYYVGIYSGIFFIVLMSISRYLAVVHALRVQTKRYGIVACLVVWILAVAASFPELCHLGIEERHGEVLCSAYPSNHADHYLRIVGFFKMNVLSLLVPLIILGFCYTMVLRRLHKFRSSMKHGMRLVFLVTVVFFCCWTPYNIAAFLKSLELKNIIPVDCETSKRILVSLQITEAVAYSHSCLNPLLYLLVGEKFKKHLIRVLRQTPCVKLKFCKSCLTLHSQTASMEERTTAI